MLSRPQLHLVTDASLERLDLVNRVEVAVQHGVDVVHVRLPDAPAKDVYDVAVVLQASLVNSPVQVVVNDRVDVALAVNAKGVQLGARSLPVRTVRGMLGPNAPIGASVHTLEEARDAQLEGATYLVFGHIYSTDSHPGGDPRGPDGLRAVVEAVDIPVIAIGGITAERVPEVLAAGAAGIAVISSILHADDLPDATRELRDALNSGSQGSNQ